jgi:hypothetical protein
MVEGGWEILGGGSPNFVPARLAEWYRDLATRLATTNTPAT